MTYRDGIDEQGQTWTKSIGHMVCGRLRFSGAGGRMNSATSSVSMPNMHRAHGLALSTVERSAPARLALPTRAIHAPRIPLRGAPPRSKLFQVLDLPQQTRSVERWPVAPATGGCSSMQRHARLLQIVEEIDEHESLRWYFS